MENITETKQQNNWAVVELMGHGVTAGIIRTGELGGLLRVDVPVEDGKFTLEDGTTMEEPGLSGVAEHDIDCNDTSSKRIFWKRKGSISRRKLRPQEDGHYSEDL